MKRQSIFKLDELAGSLVKSGRFLEAIPEFLKELNLAMEHGVLTESEIYGQQGVIARFCYVCLNPSNYDEVHKLGSDLILIAMRIPDYVAKA